jgi:hypothetical protein
MKSKKLGKLIIFFLLFPIFTGHNIYGDSTISYGEGIEILGHYSDVRITQEHAYGHEIELYKNGEIVFGMLTVRNGQNADPPRGLVQDVYYNIENNALSFKALLSCGLANDEKGKWIKSRDIFQFYGLLTKDKVSGILYHWNALKPNHLPTSKEISLTIRVERGLVKPSSYKEWKEQNVKLMKQIDNIWWK